MDTSKKFPTKKNSVKKSVKKATKKATKKKAAKKKVDKKVAKKKMASRIHKNAHPDKVFVLVNGKRVKNIKELADVMDKIEDYVFNHHVTEDRNDFAQWLHDVFEEVELAKQVGDSKEKKHVQLILYKHISHGLW